MAQFLLLVKSGSFFVPKLGTEVLIMLKKILLTMPLWLLISLGVAQATPTNLVANGNFATGDFTGWVVGGNNTGFPPSVVNTNSSCCFGEFVPVDSVTVGSPDLGGTHAVYFVDDNSKQTLTEVIHLGIGSYAIGFDAYAPHNGFNNSGDAFFSGTIAGVQLANYSVHGQNNPGAWVNFSGIADILTAGDYSVTFSFQTFGGASADVLIDRVFVTTTDQTGGIPIGGSVPEPTTLALFGLGLVGVAFGRRKN